MEVLRNEDLQANSEAFLYCMGAIKFISGNPGFLNEMISKGAVEILMNLIKQINEHTRKCGTCLPNSGHLLVQVSILLEVRGVKLVCMVLTEVTCRAVVAGHRRAVTASQVGVPGFGDQGW